MSERRSAFPSVLAAVVSVFAMLGCCLPLPAVLAAGSLGALSAWLPSARNYFLASAIATLAYAFYQLYRRHSCYARRPWWLQVMVWGALFSVLAIAWLPQRTANFLAGRVPIRAALAPPPLTTLRDLSALRERFNAASSRTRVIALLSPT
jgi:hypothetical protein